MAWWELSYNPESAIQHIIDTGKKPTLEEGSVSWVCIEESVTSYDWEWDFEPIFEPTFDEKGNQTGFEIPEEQDPDNLCPTQEELDSAFN